MDTTPGPVPVYSCPQRVFQQVNCESTPNTSTTEPVKLAPPAQQDIDRLVQEQVWNLHGQRDHGDQPPRHDRDVDDLWNPRELHNRGIYHLSLDHGKPKRHDRDDDDLRRTAAAEQRHFQTVYTVWTITWQTCSFGP